MVEHLRNENELEHFSGALHGKNGFVTPTKLGTTDKIFVAATKNFAAATKRFVDRTKHFVVVTKSSRNPFFLTNDFVSIIKPFLACLLKAEPEKSTVEIKSRVTFDLSVTLDSLGHLVTNAFRTSRTVNTC